MIETQVGGSFVMVTVTITTDDSGGVKLVGESSLFFVAESVTSETDASALAVKSKLFCQTKPNTNKITEHLRRLAFYPKVGSAL